MSCIVTVEGGTHMSGSTLYKAKQFNRRSLLRAAVGEHGRNHWRHSLRCLDDHQRQWFAAAERKRGCDRAFSRLARGRDRKEVGGEVVAPYAPTHSIRRENGFIKTSPQIAGSWPLRRQPFLLRFNGSAVRSSIFGIKLRGEWVWRVNARI